MILFCTEFDSKRNMFQLFNQGQTSDDFLDDSNMHLAMLAFEEYGDATRDNSFEELVELGKELQRGES